MKTDYFVSWRQTAIDQLLEKARYIAEQSQSIEVAEKLSYVGGAYDDQNIHTFPLKNGHSVRFLVVGDVVLITEFLPKGIIF